MPKCNDCNFLIENCKNCEKIKEQINREEFLNFCIENFPIIAIIYLEWKSGN